MEQIRATVQKAALGAEEVIKYAKPAFTFNGNLVYFAAYKRHIGFYPIPAGDEALKKEFSIYQKSKSALQFPLDKPIPLKLTTKIVSSG